MGGSKTGDEENKDGDDTSGIDDDDGGLDELGTESQDTRERCLPDRTVHERGGGEPSSQGVGEGEGEGGEGAAQAAEEGRVQCSAATGVDGRWSSRGKVGGGTTLECTIIIAIVSNCISHSSPSFSPVLRRRG